MNINYTVYENYCRAAANLNLTVVETTSYLYIKEASDRGFNSFCWLPTNKIVESIYNNTKIVNGRVVPLEQGSIHNLMGYLKDNLDCAHLEFDTNDFTGYYLFKINRNDEANKFFKHSVADIEYDFKTMLGLNDMAKEREIAEQYEILNILAE
jgi:hypothetical protein